MAIDRTTVSASGVLVLQTGVNQNGNPVLRRRTFRNIKSQAADQDVWDALQALAGLQEYTLTDVIRQEVHRLEEAV